MASKDVENQREIYPYPGSKSKSEVWRYFGFYRSTDEKHSQHDKSNLLTNLLKLTNKDT